MTIDSIFDTACGAITAIVTGLAISSEDLTGPAAGLFLAVVVLTAVGIGAKVLFRAWLDQNKMDRQERTDRHTENLRLHMHNADQMKVLIESQQLAQLETAKAVRENALAISKMADTLASRRCMAEKNDVSL